MDRAMAAVFCAILLVAVLIILLAAGHLVSKNAKHKDSGQAAENTQSEKSSETIGMETQETEVTETLAQEETETEEPFTTTPIPNVESLDTTSYGWGQGVQFDEHNRPISAVQYQETYGKYNANFIGENRPVIYLTFDEGYEAGYTPIILDILEKYNVPAGSVLRLEPGQSISIQCGMYHQFWGEKGTGKILLGEVSKVNDDRVDNRFYKKTGRFPQIEEDEPAIHLLGNEYPAAE